MWKATLSAFALVALASAGFAAADVTLSGDSGGTLTVGQAFTIAVADAISNANHNGPTTAPYGWCGPVQVPLAHGWFSVGPLSGTEGGHRQDLAASCAPDGPNTGIWSYSGNITLTVPADAGSSMAVSVAVEEFVPMASLGAVAQYDYNFNRTYAIVSPAVSSTTGTTVAATTIAATTPTTTATSSASSSTPVTSSATPAPTTESASAQATSTASTAAPAPTVPQGPAPAVSDDRATLSTFAGGWIGHTRSLSIARDGRGSESIYAGCCHRVLNLTLRLSQVRGTSRSASATITVIRVSVADGHAFTKAWRAPRVGQIGMVRLEDGVLLERVTGETYCDGAAEALGKCGA